MLEANALVNDAYYRADDAWNRANNAQSRADSAYNLANSANNNANSKVSISTFNSHRHYLQQNIMVGSGVSTATIDGHRVVTATTANVIGSSGTTGSVA